MPTTVFTMPGVYLRDERDPAPVALPLGVPGFVGLVGPEAPAPVRASFTGALYGPVVLRRKSDFPGGAAAYLEHALNGFFDNGGGHCQVVGVRAMPKDADAGAGLIQGLALLAPLRDVDLIVIPDAVALPTESGVRDVQAAMVRHCTEQGNRVALLDSLPAVDARSLIARQVENLGLPRVGPVNAALYHPWIRTAATGTDFVPPCGHVAGVIARTDALAGVYKAPANIEVQGAIDLSSDLDADAMGLLNAAGVNCLRALPARGIRVWGARTLSADPAWSYLNVRRLVLTVLRWIDLNMTWAAFEPNVPALWVRIQRELNSYLAQWWRAGALQGDTVNEAFYVRCDAELNPPAMREMGQVVTEIGLAPTVPAEFIVVSIQHRAGTTELI